MEENWESLRMESLRMVTSFVYYGPGHAQFGVGSMPEVPPPDPFFDKYHV
jgi:hypothetical protein